MSSQGSEYGLSDIELKVICQQIERRKECRAKFLKARTDPCKHSKEAGYVFDPAIQKFLSMKNCQLEYFDANIRTIRYGIFSIIVPMFLYGSILWYTRTKRETEIRCGRLKYRDRQFKLC